MDGEPVWLASGSLWHGTWNVLTGEMTSAQRDGVMQALAEVLDGIGNADHERAFRMNLTLCIHRRLTDAEKSSLSRAWCAAPAIHLAGGPVELLWAKGLQDKPTVRPCEAPVKRWVNHRVWLPTDCGRCDPCTARRRLIESMMAAHPEIPRERFA